jgi:hypothetical protein
LGNGRLVQVRLFEVKVENIIRWRQSFDAEEKSLRESNAKLIR